MNSVETAINTRREHERSRRAKDQEKKTLRQKMTYTCVHVLDDPTASSADKVTALEILHDLSEWR